MEIYIFFDILIIAYSFVTVMIFKSLLLLILFFSASQRVVTALSLSVEALVCLRAVLCGGERVRA